MNDLGHFDDKKLTNKDLYDRQVEMLKIFLDHNLITQDKYEYELKVLKEKIKID